MSDITLKQKKLLEPYGQAFATLGQQIRNLSDEDAAELLKACYATSTTNCWCCTFDAAQWLQRELRREIYRRKQTEESRAANREVVS